ncbi:MAG: nucleotidyltransferase family protein [Planctomycetes bacterium]|nr:nucleotidyltransferase family protein [Planctomycetota bacterium]
MAMDRVERRLRRVTAALDAAGIPYAVIGGNAVAAWVAGVDPAATRTTRDVDLLVVESDEPRIAAVMEDLGFLRHDLRRLILFVDPEEPSKRSGVHLVWADRKIRPSYPCPSPSVTEAVRSPEGFLVLGLSALVRMKLTSFRDIDRVHVKDLLRVGLIAPDVRDSLPPVLRERLEGLEGETDED